MIHIIEFSSIQFLNISDLTGTWPTVRQKYLRKSLKTLEGTLNVNDSCCTSLLMLLPFNLKIAIEPHANQGSSPAIAVRL